MLLAIDVSNTNTKFAVVDGDRIVGEWRAAHRGHAHRRRVRGLADAAHAHGRHRPQVDHRRDHRQRRAAANFNLRRLCTPLPQLEPLVIGEPDCRPRHRGAHRQAVGGRRRPAGQRRRRRIMLSRAPLIVVDFGTATTFDVVDEDGGYLRRRDRARHQPLDGGAAPRRRAAAAHRGPEARAGHRQGHRRLPCSPASSGAMSA